MDNTKNAIEDPTSAEAYVDRGNKFYNQGDYQAAISDYDEAIRLDPEYARAYFNRGNAKDELGDVEGAISDYDEAIRLDPKYVGAYYNRGLAKGKLGKYFEAISDYDQAIRLDPDDAIAYYNNTKRGKYFEAMPNEANPDDAIGGHQKRIGTPRLLSLIMMRRSDLTLMRQESTVTEETPKADWENTLKPFRIMTRRSVLTLNIR